MKTIHKKNQSLEFVSLQARKVKEILTSAKDDMDRPAVCDGETLGVKVGKDLVGIVSLLSRIDGDLEEELIITQLYILPQFRNFGIGTKILEALSLLEGVTFIRVIATPATFSYYEDRGFERDEGHIVLTKVILNE